MGLSTLAQLWRIQIKLCTVAAAMLGAFNDLLGVQSIESAVMLKPACSHFGSRYLIAITSLQCLPLSVSHIGQLVIFLIAEHVSCPENALQRCGDQPQLDHP